MVKDTGVTVTAAFVTLALFLREQGFSSRSEAGRDQDTPHAARANAPSHLTLQTVSTFHFLRTAQTLGNEITDRQSFAVTPNSRIL